MTATMMIDKVRLMAGKVTQPYRRERCQCRGTSRSHRDNAHRLEVVHLTHGHRDMLHNVIGASLASHTRG